MSSGEQLEGDLPARGLPESQTLSIGDYRILEKLGAGSMGMVFRAQHRRLGRVVALRILPPSFARDPTAIPRFKSGIEAAARVNHPNLVAILEAAEDRGVLFLVVEYVDGLDLDGVVRLRGPLRVGEAIDFLIQAARGLEAAHAGGIFHGDIRPSNLMLDDGGVVRVLDLGLAPIEEPKQADPRADIYGLGCTLYLLLTGREPFVADTGPERTSAHQERPAPPLRAIRPDVPSTLEAVCRKMMARQQDDRPGSMTEVIALLESCRSSTTESLLPTDESQAASARSKDIDESALTRVAPRESGRDSSIFARLDGPSNVPVGSDLDLEELVLDMRREIPPPTLSEPTVKKSAHQPTRPERMRTESVHRLNRPTILVTIAAAVALGAVFLRFILSSRPTITVHDKPLNEIPVGKRGRTDNGGQPKNLEALSIPQHKLIVRTIFDGKTGRGWMLTSRKPIPAKSIEHDGLNPHRTDSYLLVYERKLADFVLDCDYKLSKGAKSGVFVRVGDLNDPVNSGIKVALDDSTGSGTGDSGAFYDLVPPIKNAQRPAGEWNHLTITAEGPVLAVSLNGTEVSRIDLDEWSVPGKRPDGTDHQFKSIAIANLPRSGYLGFQNLKGDCWFRSIQAKSP